MQRGLSFLSWFDNIWLQWFGFSSCSSLPRNESHIVEEAKTIQDFGGLDFCFRTWIFLQLAGGIGFSEWLYLSKTKHFPWFRCFDLWCSEVGLLKKPVGEFFGLARLAGWRPSPIRPGLRLFYQGMRAFKKAACLDRKAHLKPIFLGLRRFYFF